MRLTLIILLFTASQLFSQVTFIGGSHVAASSSGSGAGGFPTLTYTPSAGSDRLLLFSILYERDHSGAKGSNWANPKSVGGADPIVTLGAASLTRLRTANYYQYSGLQNTGNATMSVELIVYGILETNIPAGLNTFVVSGVNTPGHSGDDATISAMMFENVVGVTYLGSAGCESCNGLALVGLDPLTADNMIISFGASGSDRDFSKGAGYTMVGTTKTVNGSGGYTSFSEKDGIATATQYITGTTALQTAPFGLSGLADLFGAVEIGFRLVSNIVLPVELLSFDGYTEEMDNTLNWSAAVEINNDRFDIERSENGLKWDKIAEVYGQGNSAVQHDYSYYDENADCDNCYYRLRQVDLDGAYEYSGSILLVIERKKGFNVYPNPAVNDVTVDMNEELGEIALYNSSGQLLMTIENSVIGKNRLNVSSLTRGHYYFVVRFLDRVETRRLVKL
ncbi:MAG: hypothetical protein ACJA0Q_000127 [Saprospiraceae bacterium]|jgi:hypothetical protein